MRIDVLTLFPAMFDGPFRESIIGRARDAGLVHIHVVDLREYTLDRHRVADDEPFGGGPGMVMKPEPLFRAVEDFVQEGTQVILMCPQGEPYHQSLARRLSHEAHLVILCGRYEGVDERVRRLVNYEISLGDFILTGGEIPAMALVDSIVRLVPGVLGDEQSAREDSFALGLLEGPQYTRPREFRGERVPEVLLSGNHEAIRRWRRKEGLRRTWLRRPDLLADAPLTEEDKELLQEIYKETAGLDTPKPGRC